MDVFQGTDATTAVELAESVIAEVVERAALQVEGMKGFSSRFYEDMVEGISERFRSKRCPGITIHRKKSGLYIHLYIITSLDRNLLELAQDMQQTVNNALHLMLNIEARAIDINIEGISYDSQGEIIND